MLSSVMMSFSTMISRSYSWSIATKAAYKNSYMKEAKYRKVRPFSSSNKSSMAYRYVFIDLGNALSSHYTQRYKASKYSQT